MKGTIGLLLMLMMLSCGGNNEVVVGNKTTMKVNEVFDGGKVILGEKVDAVFKVENTGDYPLVISEVTPSCGCTVVEKPKDPIMPGEVFEIRGYVNTDNAGIGTMNKTITLTANTEPSGTVVRVTARVVKQ